MIEVKKTIRRNSKAISAGVGASIAMLVFWILGMFNIEVPEEVQAAVTVLVTTIITWLAPANESVEV